MNLRSISVLLKSIFLQSRYQRMLKKEINKETALLYGESDISNDCLKNITIFKKMSLKNLSSCEFIIVSGVLPDFFIKKDGQKIICLPKYEYSVFFGKMQRTLLMSDYIICPDCKTEAEIIKNFQLNGIYKGTVINGGSETVNKILSGNNPKGKSIYKNAKRTLIYSGSLAQNGLTASLMSLLSGLKNLSDNFYITYREESVRKTPDNLKKIPNEFHCIPMSGKTQYTISEFLCYILYFKLNISNRFIENRIDRLYKREWKRLFGSTDVSCAIQFTGYEYGVINMFRCFEGKRIIYVHNNMTEEINSRKNQHYKTLQKAYREYDTVALVTEDMRRSALEISGGNGENFTVVPNCHNYERVLEKSRLPIEFQQETESNVTLEQLQDLLASEKLKFITIGRFSTEKAHIRLIDAFEEFYKSHSESCLIIIGGRGELYEETLKYAESCKAEIILIKSMENPMPVLNKCDLFMLPSRYEGLGLVLLEADTLGIPVFATDIDGPRGFMKEHGGLLVPDDIEGILSGMNMFVNGKIKPMNVDYAQYNEDALNRFMEICNLK